MSPTKLRVAWRIAPAGAHLDGVVAGQNQQIALLDQREQQRVGLRRQAGGAQAERFVLGQHALGLVGREQRYALLPGEGGDARLGTLVQRVDARHQQRPLGVAQPPARLVERGARRRRATGRAHAPGDGVLRLLRRGDADGDIHQHRSRLIVGGDGHRLVDDHVHRTVGDREGGLGDRREQGAVIEYLVGVGERVARVHAAGEKDHGHAILPGVGDDVDRVGDAGPQGRHQHAGGAAGVVRAFGHEPR
jgi:hypothetical protein